MAAAISANFSYSTFKLPLPSSAIPRLLSSKARFSSSASSMDSEDEVLRAKFMEFPYVSGPHKDLMVEVLSSVDSRIGPSLQRSCTLPPDVQHFGNSTGTARASLHVRSGFPCSQVDFILGSWIHCKLPSGGTLDMTTLSAYLKPSTDAPHFLLELIQSSPTSLLMILDLIPRKDLIMYSDYIKTYYEDTQLDKHRQKLHILPEVKPYFSPSLYIRADFSPTAILVTINVGDGETTSIEGIIRDHVGPVAKEVLEFWLDSCACVERDVGESDMAYLAERDRLSRARPLRLILVQVFQGCLGKM